MPKVSVIIPTYNRASLIGRAIDSVLAQTFTDYEIVVIDDGSTDNTRNVMTRYNGKVKYIVQENQGISNARNRGIAESTGEYIAFLDSDDYWSPHKLAKQTDILNSNKKVGIVFCRMPIVDEKGTVVGMKPAGACGLNFKELIEIWGDLPTSTVMTRRECFDKAGVFDPSLPSMEDIDMWLRIAQSYDLHEIKGEYLAFYSRHETQTTKSKIKVFDGLVKIYLKILRIYPDVPQGLMKRRIVSNQYLLSRAYYNEQYYSQALTNLLEVIGRDPLLGRLFFYENDGIARKLLKIIKPYGFLMVCCLRWCTTGILRFFIRKEGARS